MIQKALILVSGHPAAGKSTLAKKISEELNIPLVSPDAIKETMWDNMGWDHDVENWHKFGGTSYELMYLFIHSLLSREKSVIVDANFSPEKANSRLKEIKKKYGCVLLQINCSCSKEEIIKRFKERLKSNEYHSGHKHGITKIYSEGDVYSRIEKGNYKLDIDGKTFEVDTTNPEKIDYKKIFEFIKND